MQQVFTNHQPWDEDAQRQRVLANFESARVISNATTDIGLLKVIYSQAEVYLSQIQILPEFQGHGLGTKLITKLQKECAFAKWSIILHVLNSNRVVPLYARLGFIVIESNEHSYTMRWSKKG